jgi:predicted nucleotidyltransferase
MGIELAKATKLSQTAIKKTLILLKSKELINLEKKVILSVKLNRNNKNIFYLKKLENLKQIYESSLINELSNKCLGSTIILFGSFSRGEDTEESDIDIAIIESDKKTINLEKYQKIFNRKIDLHFYKEFKIIPKNLKESIVNGIILKGAIKL